VKIQVHRVESEADVESARDYARRELLGRALLHATLHVDVLRERSRHWLATLGERVVGLVAQIDGVFDYRSAPLASSLPRAATALVARVERPAKCLAHESLWPELERASAQREREYLQMGRLRHDPLPAADPAVKRIDDAVELASFLGDGLTDIRHQLGPFVGIRDDDGALAAVAGTEFVTRELAQLAWIQSHPDQRRQGLARATVAALVAELETPERIVILQVRAENHAAIALYGGLGFRGTRRVARYSLSA
jgi:ribosomal protein S18 acetylase RimI-like enzyme